MISIKQFCGQDDVAPGAEYPQAQPGELLVDRQRTDRRNIEVLFNETTKTVTFNCKDCGKIASTDSASAMCQSGGYYYYRSAFFFCPCWPGFDGRTPEENEMRRALMDKESRERTTASYVASGIQPVDLTLAVVAALDETESVCRDYKPTEKESVFHYPMEDIWTYHRKMRRAFGLMNNFPALIDFVKHNMDERILNHAESSVGSVSVASEKILTMAIQYQLITVFYNAFAEAHGWRDDPAAYDSMLNQKFPNLVRASELARELLIRS